MCARSIYHIHICFYIYMYTCTCVYVLARRQNIFCMHASECGQAMCACVWVREGECVWCSVLYASEPLPAGIRKVDLGHKYLISVCCPWKSSIYSQPNGKMPLSDPLPFSSRQKEMQRWEAVRGTLTWYGWSRTEATPEKKTNNAHQLLMRSHHREVTDGRLSQSLSLFVWSEKNCDTIQRKTYHRQQNIGYYVFDTVKQNKCQTKIVGLDTRASHTSLFWHFLKQQDHFPCLMYRIKIGVFFTKQRVFSYVCAQCFKGESQI